MSLFDSKKLFREKLKLQSLFKRSCRGNQMGNCDEKSVYDIVIISRYNPWKCGGGLENVVKEQIKSVESLGLKIHILYRERIQNVPTIFSDLIYAVLIYLKATKINCKILLDNFGFTFLYKFLKGKSRNVVVIKVHHGTSNYLDSYSGIRLIFAKIYKLFILKPVCIISSRLADINIVVSCKVKQELINHYKVPPEKVIVIPNGVNVNMYRPRDKKYIRELLGLPLDKKIVLFVGGDLERKGFWLALNIVKKVKKYISNILFVAITSKKYKKRLESLKINWLKILTEVPHNKMPYLYNASDLLLLPSKYEGLPLTVLEALASGCPAVVSPNAAEGEYNGQGFLIAHNFEEYVKYCKKLLTDTEYWMEISSKARDLAVLRYNIQNQHKLYQEIILKLLKLR